MLVSSCHDGLVVSRLCTSVAPPPIAQGNRQAGLGKTGDVSKAGAADGAMQTPADHAAGQRHERGWTATDDCVRETPGAGCVR